MLISLVLMSTGSYWRNVEDDDVGRFMKLFTAMPLDEIERLAALDGAERNEAKKILATEATAMLHGRAAAADAAETSRKTFEQGTIGDDLPTIELASGELDGGMGILAALVRAGLAGSNSEARRSIKGGAIKLNDAQVTDEKSALG